MNISPINFNSPYLQRKNTINSQQVKPYLYSQNHSTNPSYVSFSGLISDFFKGLKNISDSGSTKELDDMLGIIPKIRPEWLTVDKMVKDICSLDICQVAKNVRILKKETTLEEQQELAKKVLGKLKENNNKLANKMIEKNGPTTKEIVDIFKFVDIPESKQAVQLMLKLAKENPKQKSEYAGVRTPILESIEYLEKGLKYININHKSN